MSQTDKGHWREPPQDRVDPDYPPHLTERYDHIPQGDEMIIYEDGDNAGKRWVNGVAFNREDML